MKNQEVLNDRAANGNKREWAIKKRNAEYLKAIYKYQKDERKSERLAECSSTLAFVKTGNTMKLKRASFCRIRLCPICTWRRSLKLYGQLDQIIESINRNKEKYKYLFVTLTVRNIKGNELKNTIDKMMKAWNLYKEYISIKKIMLGSVRTFEVTYNQEDDTYHPHFHVLMLVPNTYFNKGKYLTQKEFAEQWGKALKETYTPHVWVRKVIVKKNKNDISGITRAILEVAKYSVKESDYLSDDFTLSCKIVSVLDKALANRRFIAYTGVVKETQKNLRLADIEGKKADLINTDNKEESESKETETELLYVWNSGFGNYYLSKN